jgi:hypothetical protein
MPSIKNRLIAGMLVLVLAVAVAACGDDGVPSTTAPGLPGTTEPVGS